MEEGRERLITSGSDIKVAAGSRIHDAINKMMATAQLNPYERELLYGYPYIVGQHEGTSIRAPLFTIPISITAEGGTLLIHPEEELLRFNSLPFHSEFETAAHEAALGRLISDTPEFPLQIDDLKRFVDSLSREMKTASTNARLDGTLVSAPIQPRAATALTVVDNSACFVAPKTSYFLASDLGEIARAGAKAVGETALGWLMGGHGATPTSDVFKDSRRVYFPFVSNASQRRVALLAEDPNNQIVVVQGPPGTGKSLTIANVACHLVASGKRVLISAQKDKAMQVVDEELRALNFAQMPMTLLRQDRESKQELRDRLDSIQKTRAASESAAAHAQAQDRHGNLVKDTELTEHALGQALEEEDRVEKADIAVREAPNWLRRLQAQANRWSAVRHARKRAPKMSDELGDQTSRRREELLNRSVHILSSAAEHRTGKATRDERNQLKEFSKLLGRNQTSVKNFSVFDRMKADPGRCEMLLKILPCWIMSPDDVARLFPCTPGLFDVVIIDEASQCDLPSMTPVLYRAKQAIIAGDSKQMQAQRFAFTATQVAAQAWREHGLEKLDPDGNFDPGKISLLELASVRGSEEAFLDEHFRSLPGIISFSNDRWYRSRMRLMRDPNDRRCGDPDAPVCRLHHVKGALVTPNTQENALEAKALVSQLRSLMANPGYSDASFGVVCLFEQQVGLIQELVSEQIEEDLREAHDLVVVNPDGFQGDERDVLLFSLSYDATNMDQAALSARQADRPHIQGMLNVAFTRAREEMHIFHSAPIERFGMASGEGAIKDWLAHCAKMETTTFNPGALGVQRAQSEFEVEVMEALRKQGLAVVPQYPSCGFFIDLVAQKGDARIAIECDGEIWHQDEHGKLKIEDVQRQEILERARWCVLRIPYRKWRADPASQIARVTRGLIELTQAESGIAPLGSESSSKVGAGAVVLTKAITVDPYEASVLKALRGGAADRETVLRTARIHLGHKAMGSRIRSSIESAISSLQLKKLIAVEESELFAIGEGKDALLSVTVLRRRGYRRRRY
jgi:very-short-patch-repair endonuclease